MTSLIDLSRQLHHRMPTYPTHAPVTMMRWGTHDEVKQAEDVVFTSASMFITLGDHAGTHVDAPAHFDAAPVAATVDQQFYTSAICLDLSHMPLKSDVTVADLEAAEAASNT